MPTASAPSPISTRSRALRARAPRSPPSTASAGPPTSCCVRIRGPGPQPRRQRPHARCRRPPRRGRRPARDDRPGLRRGRRRRRARDRRQAPRHAPPRRRARRGRGRHARLPGRADRAARPGPVHGLAGRHRHDEPARGDRGHGGRASIDTSPRATASSTTRASPCPPTVKEGGAAVSEQLGELLAVVTGELLVTYPALRRTSPRTVTVHTTSLRSCSRPRRPPPRSPPAVTLAAAVGCRPAAASHATTSRPRHPVLPSDDPRGHPWRRAPPLTSTTPRSSTLPRGAATASASRPIRQSFGGASTGCRTPWLLAQQKNVGKADDHAPSRVFGTSGRLSGRCCSSGSPSRGPSRSFHAGRHHRRRHDLRRRLPRLSHWARSSSKS